MKGKHHTPQAIEKLKKAVTNSDYHTKIKGKPLTEKQKNKIKKYMVGVFTLDWFEKKYGKTEGKKLYKKRNNNIAKKSFFKIYNKQNRNNYSKKSQKLFWSLYKKLNLNKFKIYFQELNHEYSCGTDSNFDFVFVDKKKSNRI